jgi:ligand-binding sensor domain-containing protein
VASGQEFGRGVIEVRLPSGRATHHRPYTAQEAAPAEAIPVVGDVAAIRFEAGKGNSPESIWFCSSTGVLRFGGGNLERWGENEGLENEHCNDLVVGPDGTVWGATDGGGARFDGKQWYPAVSATAKPHPWPIDREGENLPARAVVAVGQGIWGATPKGVWPLKTAGIARPLDRATGLFDDDVVDVVVDRFGRLWSLGHIGLTIRPSLSDISHM